MLKIGEFSRISHVSAKTLRYYDEIGLFRPAQVDRLTGYRYYSMGQLPRLKRILALKDLGLSLEQIAVLLGDELSPAEIRGMLRLKRAEIQHRLQEETARLALVEARLAQIENGWLEARNEGEGMSMGSRICPVCGKETQDAVVRCCPHCGAGLTVSPAPLLPVKKTVGQLAKRSVGLTFLAVLLIIAVSALVIVVQCRRAAATPSLMSGPLSESQPLEPQLALLAVKCEKSALGDDQFVFEGEVQNVSDSSLRDVIAVVAMYDDNPVAVGSAQSPIECTTLQPGQISSFEVVLDYDPTVVYYKLKFKDRPGDTIPTRHDVSG